MPRILATLTLVLSGLVLSGLTALAPAAQAAPPANDTPATALKVDGAKVDLSEATADPGLPGPGTGCASGGAGPSVWFRFDTDFPGYAGQKYAQAYGGDPVIRVYASSGLGQGALTYVGCNDDMVDSQGTYAAQAVFTAVYGVSYFVEVSSSSAVPGDPRGPGRMMYSLTSSSSRSSADNYPTRLPINYTDGMLAINTGLATAEVEDPGYAAAPSPTMWFQWQAPATGVAEFKTAPFVNQWLTVDTFLRAMVGSEEVAFNDDQTPGTTYSRIRFPVTAGYFYQIQLGALRTRPGEVLFTWSMPDIKPTSTTLSAGSNGGTVEFATTVAAQDGATATPGAVEIREDGVLRTTIALTPGVGSGSGTGSITGVPAGVHVYRAVYVPSVETVSSSVSPGKAVAVVPTPVPTPGPTPGPTPSPGPTVPPSPGPTPTPAPTPAPTVRVASALTLTAPKTSVAGKRPRISVQVKRGTAPAGGVVIVTLKGKKIATLTLVGGSAKLRLPALAKGKAKLTATYTGDPTTLASSASATITVTRRPRG